MDFRIVPIILTTIRENIAMKFRCKVSSVWRYLNRRCIFFMYLHFLL